MHFQFQFELHSASVNTLCNTKKISLKLLLKLKRIFVTRIMKVCIFKIIAFTSFFRQVFFLAMLFSLICFFYKHFRKIMKNLIFNFSQYCGENCTVVTLLKEAKNLLRCLRLLKFKYFFISAIHVKSIVYKIGCMLLSSHYYVIIFHLFKIFPNIYCKKSL